MRFSVICTNYNKSPYLSECIESVLSQEMQDFEFIIIDDASTDESVSIIKSYVDNYSDKIIFFKNESNIGMAAGYNKAFAIAKGEIVCLIDSDDFWYPGKLNEVNRCFRENTGCVMHQHLLQVYNFHEKTEEIYRPYLMTGDLFRFMIDTKQIPLFVTTTGLSFEMSTLRKVLPIPIEFSKNGEAFLTRTLVYYGYVVTSQVVLGSYRKTDTNLVFGNPSWDSFQYIEKILKPALNQFYKKEGVDLFFAPCKQKSVEGSFFGALLAKAREYFSKRKLQI
jgi:glycosyltransferase involved in cell wall biosynthesis